MKLYMGEYLGKQEYEGNVIVDLACDCGYTKSQTDLWAYGEREEWSVDWTCPQCRAYHEEEGEW